jgi:hypothetical protein
VIVACIRLDIWISASLRCILVESKEEGFDYTTRRYYSRDKSIIPSIPMEIDLLLKPTKNLGFGITLWGDLNFNAPIYGLMLKVAIGKLR